MQTHGRPPSGTSVLTFAATLAFATVTHAQETQNTAPAEAATTQSSTAAAQLTPDQEALARNFYRAEFVILERKVDPAAINEHMASRLPEAPDPSHEEILRTTDETGATRTTLKLVSRNELHLQSAARRLANSGRYRILLSEGWYQAFPPDFEGKPLQVAIGDWLPDAQHTDVQGQITIDRQRYLHVDVQLNHWQPKPAVSQPMETNVDSEETSPGADAEMATTEPAENTMDQVASQEPAASPSWPRAELLTWIRETRRMRSEEVHFLDSPTLGVLIFFKKIEPTEAASLIRRSGL